MASFFQSGLLLLLLLLLQTRQALALASLRGLDPVLFTRSVGQVAGDAQRQGDGEEP
jgi:hypothetical protein